MEILDARTDCEGGQALVSIRFLPNAAAHPQTLWYKFEGLDTVPDNGMEAAAVALLTASMYLGESLVLNGAISRTLAQNLASAQRLLRSWYDWLTPTEIRADTVAPRDEWSERRGVASCFTAGVDSWYSLLKNAPRLTHLLLIRGFDIGLENDALWNESKQRIAMIAERMGKRLVTCETNLRSVADMRRADWAKPSDKDFWGACLHGAALASVGILMQGRIRELIVPATHTEGELKPWGSSPLLDGLWSNDGVTITHDGCEAGRVEKTKMIARSELALETLRVCYRDTLEYNCGQCEKCLRTQLALRLAGALKRATTFTHTLTLRDIRALVVPAHVRYRYDELIDEAVRCGDREVRRAVEAALGRRFSPTHILSLARQTARSSLAYRRIKPVLRALLADPMETFSHRASPRLIREQLRPENGTRTTAFSEEDIDRAGHQSITPPQSPTL